MELKRLVAYLNQYLRVGEYEEAAINGLQVEAGSEVKRIAFAVDGVLETFERAAEAEADLLIVHHGIYWGRQWALRGPDYKRIKVLMDHDLALYAAHLPLDAHEEVGHAASLLRHIGAEELEPFGRYKGQTIGFMGRVRRCRFESLAERLAGVLGQPPMCLAFGPDRVRTVACVTGQGASFGLLREAKLAGVHCYISGEADHPTYHYAKEHELNLCLGGHYRTEVFGLKALQQHLVEQFEVETAFLDIPTGM